MLNSANLILNKFTKTLVKTDRGGGGKTQN